MSPTKASNFSVDDLMKPGFWDAQRNRLIGVAIVAAIIVLAVLVFRNQSSAKQATAWEAMLGDDGLIAERPAIDGAIEGTSAEPWAIWVNARTSWDERDFAAAEASLADLMARFPEHPATMEASAFLEDVRKQKEWIAAHGEKKNNPDPDPSHCVTLATSLGEIEIGLYPEAAPYSTREFLKLIRTGAFQKAAFQEGFAENFIALAPASDPAGGEGTGENGAPDDAAGEGEGAAEKPSDLAQGRVPDRNSLSHYEGAISFQRQQGADAKAQPKVAIYLRDMGYLDNSQVVFGRVTKGLELLKEASKREKGDTGTTFKEPLVVDGYREAEGLKDLP